MLAQALALLLLSWAHRPKLQRTEYHEHEQIRYPDFASYRVECCTEYHEHEQIRYLDITSYRVEC